MVGSLHAVVLFVVCAFSLSLSWCLPRVPQFVAFFLKLYQQRLVSLEHAIAVFASDLGAIDRDLSDQFKRVQVLWAGFKSPGSICGVAWGGAGCCVWAGHGLVWLVACRATAALRAGFSRRLVPRRSGCRRAPRGPGGCSKRSGAQWATPKPRRRTCCSTLRSWSRLGKPASLSLSFQIDTQS